MKNLSIDSVPCGFLVGHLQYASQRHYLCDLSECIYRIRILLHGTVISLVPGCKCAIKEHGDALKGKHFLGFRTSLC
jgi:hypothetical protein